MKTNEPFFTIVKVRKMLHELFFVLQISRSQCGNSLYQQVYIMFYSKGNLRQILEYRRIKKIPHKNSS